MPGLGIHSLETMLRECGRKKGKLHHLHLDYEMRFFNDLTFEVTYYIAVEARETGTSAVSTAMCRAPAWRLSLQGEPLSRIFCWGLWYQIGEQSIPLQYEGPSLPDWMVCPWGYERAVSFHKSLFVTDGITVDTVKAITPGAVPFFVVGSEKRQRGVRGPAASFLNTDLCSPSNVIS